MEEKGRKVSSVTIGYSTFWLINLAMHHYHLQLNPFTTTFVMLGVFRRHWAQFKYQRIPVWYNQECWPETATHGSIGFNLQDWLLELRSHAQKCTKTLMDKLCSSMFTLQKGDLRQNYRGSAAFRHGVLQQRDNFLALLHGCLP